MLEYFFENSRKVGVFQFGEKIDVTDPAYRKGVRCRLAVAAKPGVYDCRVAIDNKGFIEAIIIHHVDAPVERLNINMNIRCVGEICVDAALAGFFNDKPDYVEDGTWGNVCEVMSRQEDVGTKYYFNRDGFFSQSGYGDGDYFVYGHECAEGVYDALCIVFIPVDEDSGWDDEDDDWDDSES